MAAGARRILDVGCGHRGAGGGRGRALARASRSTASTPRRACSRSRSGRWRRRRRGDARTGPLRTGRRPTRCRSTTARSTSRCRRSCSSSCPRASRPARGAPGAQARAAGWPYVTWLRGGEPFAADAAYDEAAPRGGPRAARAGGGHDDYDSPRRRPPRSLRRAGFAGVAARGGRARAPRSRPRATSGSSTRFDDEDLFATLDGEARARRSRRTCSRGCGRCRPAGLRLRCRSCTRRAGATGPP